ncbi:ATP-binding protein [Mesorhizobium sp. CAU 1741]|uniref:ATP-binding protein n=1 Tax=Mesorhizobium sp. CAU 1741 TaxID=3140366 RepID=UPI00325C1BDE
MEDTLLPRHLRAELLDSLRSTRVVNIIGPRQVGKTTLVRELLDVGRFITLDDENVLAAIEADPSGQIEALVSEADDVPLIIDEAQRSKRLALAIKRIVDERRRMGQFILTGSSNVFTNAHVADSLAGRVQTLTLLPLSGAEVQRKGPARILDWASRTPEPSLRDLPKPEPVSRNGYIQELLAGGYPEIRNLPDRSRQRRYRDYVDTIVERDVADLIKVRKSDAMRRLIDQIAARTANELNVQEMGSIIGVQRPTIETYLDVLTKLSLMSRLPAWTSGEAGRDIRQPKVHLVDTGIVAALRNLTSESFLADANPAALGGVLETFVHNELLKSLPHQQSHWRLYHWRHQRGREIDILAETNRTIVGFEMKASSNVDLNDFRHLQWFRTDGPGSAWNVIGIVIYLGDRPLTFGSKLFALPLSSFWSFAAE